MIRRSVLTAFCIGAGVSTGMVDSGLVSATFPGKPGKIIFQNSGKYLRAIDPATERSRRVASYSRGIMGAEFFPNGNRYAYVTCCGNIFIKSLGDRGAARRRGHRVLPKGGFSVRAVGVFPSARRLVFSASPHNSINQRRTELYSVGLDGGGLRQLTHNDVFDNDPSVSPDGDRIAFVRRINGRADIFVMNPDGSHQVRLTRTGDRERGPSFSASGKRLVYFSRVKADGDSQEIFVMPANGGRPTRLTHNGLSEQYPVFSPDGRRIAYSRDSRRSASAELWVMGARGRNKHALYTGQYDNLTPDWGRARSRDRAG